MRDLIGYDEIIENSMRAVVYAALKKTEKNGLLGQHYFMITFLTHYSGVVMSKSLLERYSEEMTIAVQYQYKNLVVEEDHFKISLSFSGKYEKLVIPYKAITSFADPSVNFGIRFSTTLEDLEEDGDDKAVNGVNKKMVDLSAKVVSLDDFRKNKDHD